MCLTFPNYFAAPFSTVGQFAVRTLYLIRLHMFYAQSFNAKKRKQNRCRTTLAYFYSYSWRNLDRYDLKFAESVLPLKTL